MATPPISNWRPRITGNFPQDEANRIAFDYIYQLRDMTVPQAVSAGVTQATKTAVTQITENITSGTLAGPVTPPATADIHANRLAHVATRGALYFETDRTVLYVGSAAPRWTYAGGVMAAVFASRPADLGATDVGFRFVATNWNNVAWRWSGTAWTYVSGMYSRTQSQLAALAALLGANDAGLLTDVTDYSHVLRWTGSAWTYADPSDPAGRIEAFLVDPLPTTGWVLCDGSTAIYLKADGTTATQALPDLTSAANKAGYLKFGSPASATPNAAVAPTLTMDSFTPAGTNSALTFTGTPAVLTGTNSVPVFSGSALATHTHDLPFAYAGGSFVHTTSFGTGSTQTQVSLVALSGTTGTVAVEHDSAVSAGTPAGTVTAPTLTMNSFTPQGTINTPAFTGTPAVLTGTISATAEPRNLILRPWFRC